MPQTNDDVARLLYELTRLTELDEGDPNSFRVRAYNNAARAVDGLTRDVAEMSAGDLANVKGIGKSTATKIRQFVDEGRIDKLDALRVKFPPGVVELLKVPGLGPKSIQLLDEVLGVRDLATLKEAIDNGRLADLPGMGDKTAENLASAIDRMHLTSKEHRRPIAEVLGVADSIVDRLRAVAGVERVEYAGSLRRFRDTIGDVDILVSTDDPDVLAAVMDRFATHDTVHEVSGRGDTKCSVVTHDGLSIDLRVVPTASFGAALLYFTGSKEHNIRLRQLAIDRGWKLSEYTLEDAETGEVVASETEEEVYTALGLAFVTPELREDLGEIELAASDDLPDLVTGEAMRGDLHDHSDWSGDGRNSLVEMVAAAAELGHDYLAITDHAEDLRINGINRDQMLDQRAQLRRLQEEYPDLRLLHGAELNIGIDGTVDYDDEFLEGFDWCVASVHSYFNRPAKQQTERLLTAIRNPNITAIGHLSGRRLGKRPGIEFDVGAVLDAAVETGTAIEINCSLPRLDATVEVVREGVRRGTTFVISTDAHTTGELANQRHGVRHARRAGVPAELVANTWQTERFLAWVADVHAQ